MPVCVLSTPTCSSAARSAPSRPCCTLHGSRSASPFPARGWRARSSGRARQLVTTGSDLSRFELTDRCPPLHTHTHTHPCRVLLRRFCAELVAACLQEGGLLNRESNPGAATPHSLFKLYKGQAATTANPYTLRNQFSMPSGRPMHRVQSAPPRRPILEQRQPLLTPDPGMPMGAQPPSQRGVDRGRQRPDSPPRAGLKIVSAGAVPRCDTTLTLSLNSLNFKLASS